MVIVNNGIGEKYVKSRFEVEVCRFFKKNDTFVTNLESIV